MRRKGIGGIPVADETGKAIGSIMIKDVKHLLTAYGSIDRSVSGDLQ
jgi:predicted transcriptional regulator